MSLHDLVPAALDFLQLEAYTVDPEVASMARKTTTKRLGAALKHAGDLAAQIEASMPPPKPRRDKRVMVALSDKERARVAAFAESRGEPMAAAVRNLAIAALDAMDR